MKAVKFLAKKNCPFMQIQETHFAQRTSFFHKQMNFSPSPGFFPVFYGLFFVSMEGTLLCYSVATSDKLTAMS
jgi:hypothetical protein